MTLTAFLLIFFSIFLHAGWNFMSKATRPSAAYYLIANTVAAVILTPFLFLARISWKDLGGAFWIFLAGSICFEVIYAIGLFRTYKRNDISMAYPMVRALPVLFTAILTMTLGLGKTPGVLACCGFAVVASGCFLLPQKHLKDLFTLKNLDKKALIPILIAACGTTGYTLMDSLGTVPFKACSVSGNLITVGAYLCLVQIGIALGLAPVVFCSGREIVELRRKCLLSPWPWLCGIFSTTAYFLVVTAMGYVDNVTFIQVFRQASLPVGVAAGIIFLHEKISVPKIAGTALVVAGLVMTVL